jgi:hypothetical protein
VGKIANQLKAILLRPGSQKVISLTDFSAAKKTAEENVASIRRPEELVKEGYDVGHAFYVNLQNLMSVFAEQVTTLPPFHVAHDFLSEVQDSYVPIGPPMSPLTTSFFSFWTLFDAAFGPDRETIGSVFCSLAKALNVCPLHLLLAKNLVNSRMGIYEVTAVRLDLGEGRVELTEMLTDRKYKTLIASGYKGVVGDLLYLRLAPPPVPEVSDFHIGLTTPYVLVGSPKSEWEAFFARHDVSRENVGRDQRMDKFLKFGKTRRYWAEYVFYGYLNHRPDCIFLAGIPDLPQSLPCADEFDEKRLRDPLLKLQMSKYMDPAAALPSSKSAGKANGVGADHPALHGEKISDVFLDFVTPFVEKLKAERPNSTFEEYNEALRFPWTIWNAVVTEDEWSDGKKSAMEMLRDSLTKAPVEFREVVDAFIERKRTSFAKYKYMIGNYGFYRAADGETRFRAEARESKAVNRTSPSPSPR